MSVATGSVGSCAGQPHSDAWTGVAESLARLLKSPLHPVSDAGFLHTHSHVGFLSVTDFPSHTLSSGRAGALFFLPATGREIYWVLTQAGFLGTWSRRFGPSEDTALRPREEGPRWAHALEGSPPNSEESGGSLKLFLDQTGVPGT